MTAEILLILTHLFDRWGSSCVSFHYNTLYVKSQGFLAFPFSSPVALPPYVCTCNCNICECAVTGWHCNVWLSPFSTGPHTNWKWGSFYSCIKSVRFRDVSVCGWKQTWHYLFQRPANGVRWDCIHPPTFIFLICLCLIV